MLSKEKHYLKSNNKLSEVHNKTVDILLEEKKRVETHMLFIIKIYISIFGFLFIYTGFTTKTFVLVDNFNIEETSFVRTSISILGLFLIFVVSIFGKYGVNGIAHAIKKRLRYSHKINRYLQENQKNKEIDIEHFLKIPVIYTWTTSAVIAGSLFYYLLIFGYESHYAISAILATSFFGLLVFPKVNEIFYFELKKELISLGIEKSINYKKTKFEKHINKFLFCLGCLIVFLICVSEYRIYTLNKSFDSINIIYIFLFSLLILIKYLFIKNNTQRENVFHSWYTKIVSK